MKSCKKMQAKGKVARWFKNLEDKVLENREERRVKENFSKEINNMFILAKLNEISTDKRKQD